MALAKSPAERVALRQRSLPDGMERLLQVAAGASSETLAAFAAQTGESETDIVEAARFYAREILFNQGADAYRVLGVDHDADTDTIRIHHRLLQQWLHPDRQSSDWDAIFAARVNAAWSRLRSDQRRQAYDQENPPQQRDDSAMLPGFPAWVHAQVEGDAVDLNRWRRRTPVLVLFAVCGLLAVMAIRDVQQEPVGVLGDLGEVASTPVIGAQDIKDSPVSIRIPDAPARRVSSRNDKSIAPRSTVGVVAAAKTEQKPVPVAIAPQSPAKPVSVAVVPKPVPKPVAVAVVPKPSLKPMAVAVAPKPPATPVAVAMVPKPSLKPMAVAVAPKPPATPVAMAMVPKPVPKPVAVAVVPKPAPKPMAVAVAPKPPAKQVAVAMVPKPVSKPVAVVAMPKPAQKPVTMPAVPSPAPKPVAVAVVAKPVPKPVAVAVAPAQQATPSNSAAAASAPPIAVVSASSSKDAAVMSAQHLQQAQRVGSQLIAYMSKSSAATPPIWGSLTTQRGAAQLREDLHGKGNVKVDSPNWRVGDKLASMHANIRYPDGRIGRLSADLVWRDQHWLISGLSMERAL